MTESRIDSSESANHGAFSGSDAVSDRMGRVDGPVSQPRPAWLVQAEARGWIRRDLPDTATEPSWWLIGVLLVLQVLCVTSVLGLLALALGDWVENMGVALVFGGALWLTALIWLRGKTKAVFDACLATVQLLVGLSWIAAVGLLQDLSLASMSMLQAGALFVSAALVKPRWVVVVLAACATLWLEAGLLALEDRGVVSGGLFLLFWGLFTLMAVGWGVWAWHEDRLLRHSEAKQWAAMADGVCAALLLGVAMLDVASGHITTMELSQGLGVRSVLAALITAVAWVLWQWRWRRLSVLNVGESAPSSHLPSVPLTVWGAGAVLVLASAVQPWLAPLAVIAAMAAATARWRWLAATAVMALWLLSRFYYEMAWPLVAKAGLLATLGALLLGVMALQRGLQLASTPHATVGDVAVERQSGPAQGQRRWIVGSVLVGGMACLSLLNVDVMRKEQVVRDGETLRVALAPVDPRSLMQGDYMALRFDLPADVRNALDALPDQALRRQVDAIAQVRNGEARIVRLARPGEPLADDERRMPLKRLKSEWVLVTDAYFFPEGEGVRFERARWGEFRLLTDGRALLVGLSDEDGQPIASAHDLRNPFW